MNNKVFFIAEAGVNHNGELINALKLVELAKRAGADAVKFQTFSVDRLLSPGAVAAKYQIANMQAPRSTQRDLLSSLELSMDDHFAIAQYCKDLGIELMSTAFDQQSLDFLITSLGVRRIKIPSGEITNLPLLIQAGASGLPVILSTGMCNSEDIKFAVGAVTVGRQKPHCRPKFIEVMEAFKDYPEIAEDITIMQCNTQYPTPDQDMNLRTIRFLGEQFPGCHLGLSDHSAGLVAPLGAIGLGAMMVEKHFTLSRNMVGPDHLASIEPHELMELLENIRRLELQLGRSEKDITRSEKENIAIARKSVFAGRDLKKGDNWDVSDLEILRPAGGLDPRKIYELEGRPVARPFKKGEMVTERELE